MLWLYCFSCQCGGTTDCSGASWCGSCFNLTAQPTISFAMVVFYSVTNAKAPQIILWQANAEAVLIHLLMLSHLMVGGAQSLRWRTKHFCKYWKLLLFYFQVTDLISCFYMSSCWSPLWLAGLNFAESTTETHDLAIHRTCHKVTNCFYVTKLQNVSLSFICSVYFNSFSVF